eukprot:COSAG04_NODE_9174_length_891_cov_0.967172_2_plen_72_part_01
MLIDRCLVVRAGTGMWQNGPMVSLRCQGALGNNPPGLAQASKGWAVGGVGGGGGARRRPTAPWQPGAPQTVP